MKLETVKSIILVVLIGLSLVLSFTLWSYQPNSDRTLSGSEDVVTEDLTVGGSGEETKRSMVKPSNIIFHTANGPYGFSEAKARDALYEKMQDWVITNFESTTSEYQFEDIDNGVELQFTDDIPMEIMNSLFTFGVEDVTLPSWSVNRIYFHFIEESKSLQVEFVSDESHRVSVGIISDTGNYDNLLSIVEAIDTEEMTRYLAVNEGESRFYIPQESLSIPAYLITPTDIAPSSFVNILFSNPSVVRVTSSQSIGETYFTDNRQMSVYQNRMRMEYVNHAVPILGEEIGISEVDLLDRSIMDINNHFGWSGNYRLEEINLTDRKTNFQLYYEGIPVFNNYKLSTIQQVWGIYQNSYHLIEYERPLFSLEQNYIFSNIIDLPSGESVIVYLENNPDIVMENIQDIRVSYELAYELESESIQLDPSWYKKENNTWQKINFDEHSSPRGE